MQSGAIDRAAVLKAMAEFDRLGRKAFLAKYGFHGAKNYFLRHEGKNYDSKAIAAVAHKYMPGGEALGFDELTGGMAHRVGAAKELQKLGFNIATSGENGDWSWDEHVLGLELYMRDRTGLPGKRSSGVLELSRLLGLLGERTNAPRTEKFRNANGVYMKLMNFSRLDPLRQALGRKGLQQGSKLEKAVWDRFANDLPDLSAAAAAIRAAIQDEEADLGTGADEDYEAEEGAIVLRWHKARERDEKLRRKKRAAVLKATGKLVCEVCSFDFAATFGAHGEGFIEIHHNHMVSQMKPGQTTKLSDLAVVCSNCHRMLHRGKPLLSINQLRGLILTPA